MFSESRFHDASSRYCTGKARIKERLATVELTVPLFSHLRRAAKFPV
jgi:hypothetical protein